MSNIRIVVYLTEKSAKKNIRLKEVLDVLSPPDLPTENHKMRPKISITRSKL